MNKLKIFSLILVLLASAFAAPATTPGRVFWKGMVDDRVQLVIQHDKIETRTPSGKVFPDGVYSFTTPLPESAVTVSVTKVKGRGSAQVVQQPTAENDFTAIVEIKDEKGGAKEYQLEISWN